MLFNTYTFLVFFAVVLIVQNLPISWRLKKFNLLFASYLFYAAWNPPFVLLLMISTCTDWVVAKKIYHASTPIAKKRWLILSLSVNLGFLVYFKYTYFLLNNLVFALSNLGVVYSPPEFDIILPVGISFYTFQTLSYTLDIYRNKMRPWNSFLDFAMFVTFFPQLVAGPIVRASDFLPQCRTWLKPSKNQMFWGLFLIILGLFQKTVVADALLAPVVETVFDSSRHPDFLSAWAGTMGFASQIFCDFAGYSTTAIGVAMCLGFRLPDNFKFPYGAVGFSDFWRRWHISLSSWLRDYLYISLGGNRNGQLRTHINLMLTMLIGGLWHGASWTFVVWGGLHGFFLIVEHWLRNQWGHQLIWRSQFAGTFLWLLTFLLTCFTWTYFRSSEFQKAIELNASMVGLATGTFALNSMDMLVVFCVTLIIVVAHRLFRDIDLETAAKKMPWWLLSLVASMMMFFITFMPSEDRAFIYFQF